MTDSLLRAAWCAETAYDPSLWTPTRPSTGQCAVTALLVQDFFGGEIMRGMVGEVSHYWNFLSFAAELDLTRDQFPHGAKIAKREQSSREYLLSSEDTTRRYLLLRSRMGLDS